MVKSHGPLQATFSFSLLALHWAYLLCLYMPNCLITNNEEISPVFYGCWLFSLGGRKQPSARAGQWQFPHQSSPLAPTGAHYYDLVWAVALAHTTRKKHPYGPCKRHVCWEMDCSVSRSPPERSIGIQSFTSCVKLRLELLKFIRLVVGFY